MQRRRLGGTRKTFLSVPVAALDSWVAWEAAELFKRRPDDEWHPSIEALLLGSSDQAFAYASGFLDRKFRADFEFFESQSDIFGLLDRANECLHGDLLSSVLLYSDQVTPWHFFGLMFSAFW